MYRKKKCVYINMYIYTCIKRKRYGREGRWERKEGREKEEEGGRERCGEGERERRERKGERDRERGRGRERWEGLLAHLKTCHVESISAQSMTFLTRSECMQIASTVFNYLYIPTLGRTYHYLLVKVVVVILCLITAFVALLLTISYWKRHDNDVKLKAKGVLTFQC